MNEKMKPLGTRESAFAAEHHDLVIRYLVENNLPEDEWYDTVIFGYLDAVRQVLRRAELQGEPFRLIANRYMARECSRARRNEAESSVRIYSLSQPLDGALAPEKTLEDTCNDIENAITALNWQETVSVLQESDRRIVALLAGGYEMPEIAQIIGVSLSALNAQIREIRAALSESLCLAA